MSTAKLTKLWSAYFEDGTKLEQTGEDRSKDYVEGAEHNKSAFSDVLAYPSEIVSFSLGGVTLDLLDGMFLVRGVWFSIELVPLKDRKLIYYRETERDMIDGVWQDAVIKRYAIGYEGKNPKGKVEKKVIFIDG